MASEPIMGEYWTFVATTGAKVLTVTCKNVLTIAAEDGQP